DIPVAQIIELLLIEFHKIISIDVASPQKRMIGAEQSKSKLEGVIALKVIEFLIKLDRVFKLIEDKPWMSKNRDCLFTGIENRDLRAVRVYSASVIPTEARILQIGF